MVEYKAEKVYFAAIAAKLIWIRNRSSYSIEKIPQIFSGEFVIFALLFYRFIPVRNSEEL